MKRPLWTHPLFAGLVAVGFCALAVLSMKRAAFHAHFKVDPLKRHVPDNTRAILFLIGSMLLVIAAIVVPLIVRKLAHARLKRALLKSVQVLLFAVMLTSPARAAEPAAQPAADAGKCRIIDMTRALEKNPLGDKDKRQRTELLEWWVSAPVTLQWCSELPIAAGRLRVAAGVTTMPAGGPHAQGESRRMEDLQPGPQVSGRRSLSDLLEGRPGTPQGWQGGQGVSRR